MIWAVVLAAGRSERMGSAKLLLPMGRSTLIETVIRGVLRSRPDGVLVVLGADREKLEPVVGRYPVRTVFNPDFARGMLSSVKRGFEAVPPDARAVLVFLGDQPAPPASVTGRIIDAYRKTGKGIVLPAYRGRRGHPVLVDLKYRDEVGALDPRIGLRQLPRAHPDDVFEVKVRTPAVLRDIDTQEDYRALLK
ncbi:MAG: nucleotidyltransferase family protein [Candidatus Aminicenantes bacterium]|nr:nucleotidyltransferase family protein [Candidatus Aminicenantes bacterium]